MPLLHLPGWHALPTPAHRVPAQSRSASRGEAAGPPFPIQSREARCPATRSQDARPTPPCRLYSNGPFKSRKFLTICLKRLRFRITPTEGGGRGARDSGEGSADVLLEGTVERAAAHGGRRHDGGYCLGTGGFRWKSRTCLPELTSMVALLPSAFAGMMAAFAAAAPQPWPRMAASACWADSSLERA